MNGPIFLAGPPRSGKTLVRWILSTHPRIAISRRTEVWPRFAGRFGDLADPANLDRCLAEMWRRPQIAALGVDVDDVREAFAHGEPTYARLFEVLHERYAARHGKPRWGDQSPGLERFADEVLAAYPGARFLHLVRDPRDVAAAEIERHPGPGSVGAATAAWLGSIRLGERNEARHPDSYRLLRYESLVGDAEPTVREICAFLGEAFDPAMTRLDGVERYREVSADGNAISSAFVFAYRRSLDPWDVAAIQRAARAEMSRFAYVPDPVDLSATGRIRCAAAWPLGLTRRGVRRSAEALGQIARGDARPRR